MRSVDAASVVEKLIELFSRVDVHQEILTDQGTKFPTKLLEELYRMLHIQSINTTPYHPQTDGLVKCFNKTLKVKRSAKQRVQTEKIGIIITLYSFCIQVGTTSFSPFELL